MVVYYQPPSGSQPFKEILCRSGELLNVAVHLLTCITVNITSHFVQIQQEIPIVLPAFSRKKAIYTTLVMVRGVAGIVGGLAVLGCLLAWTRERMRRDRVL